MDKLFFPLFIDLHGKDILFVGGGKIATRRIKSLLPFVDGIRVVAQREFELSDIKDAFLVLSCTDDHELNKKVAKVCKERGIWVNDCSDKDNSSFFFPGIARKEEVVAVVCASGQDHRKAAAYRKKLQEALDR